MMMCIYIDDVHIYIYLFTIFSFFATNGLVFFPKITIYSVPSCYHNKRNPQHCSPSDIRHSEKNTVKLEGGLLYQLLI